MPRSKQKIKGRQRPPSLPPRPADQAPPPPVDEANYPPLSPTPVAPPPRPRNDTPDYEMEEGQFSDDDEYIDELHEIFSGGCEPETWEEMMARMAPDVDADDWEEAFDVKDAKMVIGVATELGFRQYTQETEATRNMLKAEFGVERVTFPLLFDLMMGPDSKIFRLFSDPKHKLYKRSDHPKFLSFMATFFTSACYGVSSTQLFGGDMISKEALSDQKEYITTWKKLAELGLPKPADRGRTYTPSQVPFWQLLEEAFNDFCSEFLVQKLEGLDRRDLVIDDDKNHFARGAYQYDCGLKLLRHVNDNRMGNTLHSAVMSYSQLMLGVAYERVSGDSAPKASQRLIKRAFIPTAPGDSLGDLRHLGIARDRGYFDKDDVQKYILPSGAHIPASTVKRSAWLAATFDQKMSEQDPRIDISTKGPKTCYIWKLDAADRELFLHCYRNGNGGCVLSMSTEHRYPEFEMVPNYPPDMVQYNRWINEHDEIMELLEDDSDDSRAHERNEKLYEERIKASFNMLNPADGTFGPISQAILRKLCESGIVPITREQRFQCWFWFRQFSLTSSTVDKIIMLLDGTDSESFDIGAWMLIKGIIRGAVPDEVPDYVPPEERGEEEEEDEEEEADQNEEESEDSSETNSTASPSDSIDGDDALADDDDDDSVDTNGSAKFYDAHPDPERKGLLPNTSKLRSNLNGEMEDLIDRLDGEEPHYAVSEEYVESILTRLGGDAELDLEKASFATKRKLLLSWAKAPACFRPYFFEQNVAALKEIGKEVGCGTLVEKRRKPVPVRREILKHLDEHPVVSITNPFDTLEEQAAASEDHSEANEAVELTLEQRVWAALLEATFLKPLSTHKPSGAESKRTYGRRGHELETPIILSFLRDQNGKDKLCRSYPVDISDVCDAGLVAKSEDEFYAKGSIDFIAVGKNKQTNLTERVGIENKARLTNNTQGKEEKHFLGVLKHLESKSTSNAHRTAQGKLKKYFKCKAESDEFAMMVRDTHELIQLLHHSYIFNLRYVLLLIGDSMGRVKFGVLVTVSEDVRNAYGTVLFDIRETYLGFVYDEDLQPPENEDDEEALEQYQEAMNRRAERRERLGPALEAVTVNGAPIDDHSFDLTLALYKDSAKMALPVPLLKMIIPSGLAHWNVLKGGSDSITKILDGNEYQVPTSDNQSDAIGRLLMLFAYQLMKLVQLAMNDKDVSNYGSVRNARKCSSARCPYYKALELIIAECKKRVLSGRSTATVPVATALNRYAPTPARNTKSYREAAQKSHVVPVWVTGKTPKQNVLHVLGDLKAQEDREIPLTRRQQRILDRKETCTGTIVREVKPDGSAAKGKECVVCKAQTKYHCLNCKLRLCLTQSKSVLEMHSKGDISDFSKSHKVKQVDQDGNMREIYVEGSCWQHVHFSNVCQEITAAHDISQRLFE